jgi:hypothetical protein
MFLNGFSISGRWDKRVSAPPNPLLVRIYNSIVIISFVGE